MTMPNRNYEAPSTLSGAEGYRYGFNGKEIDNSTSEGSYDFGARIYDTRIGRFLSTDPLLYKYYWLSPYSYAQCNPVTLIDKDGMLPGVPPIEGEIINVFIYPENLASKSGYAHIPGYIQAKMQENSGRGVKAILAKNATDAYKQIYNLKQEGYIIKNIAIESHGHQGKYFEIGEEKFDIANVGNDPVLKQMSSLMVGRLVLMGCELGTNSAMLKKIATHMQVDVIAHLGWTSDFPGMFNDAESNQKMRPLIKSLIETAYDQVPEVKDYINAEAKKEIDSRSYSKLRKWFEKMAVDKGWAKKQVIAGATDKVITMINSTTVSPSGDTQLFGVSDEEIKKWGSKVGQWTTTSKSGDYKVNTGTFMFDKDGNALFFHQGFYSTPFGKALKQLIETCNPGKTIKPTPTPTP